MRRSNCNRPRAHKSGWVLHGSPASASAIRIGFFSSSLVHARPFLARTGYVNPDRGEILIAARAVVKRSEHVDGRSHDIVAFRDARDVDPLPDKLLVVPIAPAGRDSLKPAVVTIAAVVAILERVFKAEALF